MILETVKAAILNLGIHKFISAMCHAHSYADKLPKLWLLQFLCWNKNYNCNVLVSSIPNDLAEMYCSHQYLLIDIKKSLPRPQCPQTSKNRKYTIFNAGKKF